MRVAVLSIGTRDFYVSPDDADRLMEAAARARETGEWIDMPATDGTRLRLLIPNHALLVFREYDVDDDEGEPEQLDWPGFDFDF